MNDEAANELDPGVREANVRDPSDHRTFTRGVTITLAAVLAPTLVFGCTPGKPSAQQASVRESPVAATSPAVRTVESPSATATPSVTATPASSMTPVPLVAPSVTPVAVQTPKAAPKTPTAEPTKSATPRPPEPRREAESTTTLCGTSFLPEDGQSSGDALAAADDRFGGLGVVRVFYTEPSPWPGRAGRPDRPVVVSLKLKPDAVLAGDHDDVVRKWFETAPRDRDIFWSLHHEPEDNVEDGEFTTSEYRSAWRRLEAMAEKTGNPRLKSTLILMDWTLDSRSGRNWKDFYPGDDVIDVLGFDVYNHGWKSDEPSYYSAEKQLATIVKVAKEVDKPFGIAELGSVKLPNDSSGEGRAAWIRDLTSYLIEHKALWATYFDIDYDSDSDYRLRDAPSVAAWSEFCS